MKLLIIKNVFLDLTVAGRYGKHGNWKLRLQSVTFTTESKKGNVDEAVSETYS